VADGTHLDRILVRTRADLALRAASRRMRELETQASQHTPRGFADALRHTAKTLPAVIAELKKASPSKGLIRPDFDPARLAQSLRRGGAACLSVLTDEPFFQGGLQNLEIASAATALPCLRKDFIVDEFQIVEARAHHADAILLIVAALTDAELRHLRAAARDLQLDVLCEVHDRGELDRALPLDCEMYGVNSRNLRTFEVDTAAAEELAQHLPADAVRVAESGLGSHADIQRMSRAGYTAFLIGESLMRADDPGDALAALLQPDAVAAE
jgi:indole-3-glycerol phosphate synthase